MKRIAIGGIVHETNTFCSARSPLSDFEVLAGDAIRRERTETGTYAGSMIRAARALEMEPVCTYLAEGQPSGVIAADAYRVERPIWPIDAEASYTALPAANAGG